MDNPEQNSEALVSGRNSEARREPLAGRPVPSMTAPQGAMAPDARHLINAMLSAASYSADDEGNESLQRLTTCRRTGSGAICPMTMSRQDDAAGLHGLLRLGGPPAGRSQQSESACGPAPRRGHLVGREAAGDA